MPWLILSADEITAQCQGITYRLNLQDDIHRAIYFGTYEQRDLQYVIAVLKQSLRAGHKTPLLCVDVGANVGAYALRLARAFDSIQILAFEPAPEVADRLAYNCQLNPFGSKIKIERMALSDQKGMACFYPSDRDHSGWGSLVQFSDIALDPFQVPVTTLDQYWRDRDLHRIDLLKVDVEAHEFQLLRGATESLRSGRIRYLLIEFNGIRLAQTGRTFQELVQLITELGFKLLSLNRPLIQSMTNGSRDPQTICCNLLFQHQLALEDPEIELEAAQILQ